MVEGNRSDVSIKLAVGEQNIGANPGHDFNINIDAGMNHSKTVLESKLKPATGGRLDVFKLVVKVPVGSAAEGLKSKAMELINANQELLAPLFEVIGTAYTLETDGEGLYFVLEGPQYLKDNLKKTLKQTQDITTNLQELEGTVTVNLKVASDAKQIADIRFKPEYPIAELLKGILLQINVNGNKDAQRKVVQDLVKLVPESLKPLFVPAYLAQGAKLEVCLNSSEDLPKGTIESLPFMSSVGPPKSKEIIEQMPASAEFLKLVKEVGDAMNGKLQIYAQTKMFAINANLSAKNLPAVIDLLLNR